MDLFYSKLLFFALIFYPLIKNNTNTSLISIMLWIVYTINNVNDILML